MLSVYMCVKLNACLLYLLVTDHTTIKHLRHQLMAHAIQQEHRTAAETVSVRFRGVRDRTEHS